MLIKIVKSLGCAYGCGEGHRGLSGDRLRMQVGPLQHLGLVACGQCGEKSHNTSVAKFCLINY